MTPKVGQEIYLPSSMYMSHGADDFQGGLCKVATVSTMISAGKEVPFISVEERPGTQYNWDILAADQDLLEDLYGTSRGHADPDNRTEYNTP